MNSTPATEHRLPHAVLDMVSRRHKARKIEALLDLGPAAPVARTRRLLEIGAGSGGISHYFANDASPAFAVDAVDVVDSRQVHDGYAFRVIDGTTLPYDAESFDVVLSNHVIEHVGNLDAQRHHLSEFRRVLRRDGTGYLAVPNRWMLVEPHYRLAFLSWWPERWRSAWLRLFRRGEHYDCRPLSRRVLEAQLRAAGFEPEQLVHEALLALYRIERPGSLARRCIEALPAALLAPLGGMFPTLIYRLRRRD